jgi:hypothetical protein
MKSVHRRSNDGPPLSRNNASEFVGECSLSGPVYTVDGDADDPVWCRHNKPIGQLRQQLLSLFHRGSDFAEAKSTLSLQPSGPFPQLAGA